jgi:hypothetical protein
MNPGERPTGIIRTLPGEAKTYEFARNKMMRSYDALQAGKIPAIYVALPQRPKMEVLHLYMLVGGQIICRMNIGSFEDGQGWQLECWDGVSRSAAWWVVCTAPVSFPPEQIKMRGFQGFRYTQELW